ncbi:MAG: M18 family aminopeptidase [Peptoniphilus sp.]|nr:M18 family aminopeptidase [Peptoniphilus sp.]MDD7363285.1 M18 family aminopeptidase [Bacillota bacterium]MDY6045378.1 M18 family aminopeptidase [Peptoniphilus sp.]
MLIEEFVSFVDRSPTSYQVVEHMIEMVPDFTRLDPEKRWDLQEGRGYYLTVDDGAIVLFRLGSLDPEKMAFRVVMSHTDSPALRLLPGGVHEKDGCVRFDVEPYGAIIRSSWFDRPLSLAGRVLVESEAGVLSVGVDFKDAIATIPNLAPHLHREVNDGHVYRPGKDLVPLGDEALKDGGFLRALGEKAGVCAESILDYDLYFYPAEPSTFIGSDRAWLSAPRLDNLATAYPALRALIDAEGSDVTQVVYITDNEEVGSLTRSGGDSNFFANTLKRIALSSGEEAFYRALSRSFLMSSDMVHADHPNYPDIANSSASPSLGGGVCIKVSASRSYATQGHSGARFKALMNRLNLKTQYFANPHGQRGGSTIGPLSMRHIDIEAIDVGIPSWAMHSTREVVHARDVSDFYAAMKGFFVDPRF